MCSTKQRWAIRRWPPSALALDGINLLESPVEVPQLAQEILSRAILPMAAQVDALHIAIAAFHEVDYLLTWNCKHIANAQILPRLRTVLTELGYSVPVICTPEEMVGEDSDDN
jgi:hypothetical protein